MRSCIGKRAAFGFQFGMVNYPVSGNGSFRCRRTVAVSSSTVWYSKNLSKFLREDVTNIAFEPQTYRQYAYLGIQGKGPAKRITEILGINPDDEWSEGDPWQTKGPHKKRWFTKWQLNSGLSETEDLNAHVEAILQRLRVCELALQSLGGEYDVRMVLVSFNLQCFSFELDFQH